MHRKLFTLKEANDLLPTIKAELANLQKLSNELEAQHTIYQILKNKTVDTSSEPLFELESRLEFKQLEIKLFVENFTRKGVLLKMIEPGLLDFPSVVDGKEVLLCWREGEERITHYHEHEDGFAGRRPHPES
ncbi:cell division protein DivIVA [Paenibacillus oryzae]|uniref:Cell division protein DivIVA n=1 Tax=Paenibacillus oryzae TaxID=1844972 RepID=A0A1A5YHU0_9BACL|nr:DUF2203 domain-containing protein [Paenibacillus oryzae]OBR65162.1 cell division protein DivIVA [Paenibacillus oryzae]